MSGYMRWMLTGTAMAVLGVCVILAGAWTYTIYASSLDFVLTTTRAAVEHLESIERIGIALLAGGLIPIAIAAVAFVLASKARPAD